MPRQVPVHVLKERFSYDPITGVLSFRFNNGRAKIGEEAGTINHDGYRVIRVYHEGKRIQVAAHVAAWAIHHGQYPVFDVDHRDTDRQNNRMGNLRDARRTMNLANRNATGPYPKGVTLSGKKGKPFRAQIQVEKKKYWLGNFITADEAHTVYRDAALKAFGEFARF